MKKVWVTAIIGLLVALLVAAGVFWIVDRNRLEDFMDEGIHTYGGYTRLDFEDTVYCLGSDNSDASSGAAGILCVSGIIQPMEKHSYSVDSMRVFLGTISLSQYPLPPENSRNTFKAGVEDGAITIARQMNLEGNSYEGYTYWLILSEDNPEIYAVYIYEDGEHIADAYPGQSKEEALASRDAFRNWIDESGSKK